MPPSPRRATLVFDGDCSFCRSWVGYWEALTGDRVEYVPYQSAAGRFPETPVADFKRAIQYFDGAAHSKGADAAFHVMSAAPGYGWTLWLYQHLPGFAPLTEWLYTLIAAHRNAGYLITRALWGRNLKRPTYNIAASLFARAIALIYVIAFASFGRQALGLIGSQGIQPVREFLTEVTRQYSGSAFSHVPTIFWWSNSDFALESITWSGAILAAAAGIARPHTSGQKAAFVVLFIYYLSIVGGGQVFMAYQWDFLLLEAGFLAIFLKPALTRVWLLRWLLFRLMFASGAVKLLSHDRTWRNLTALAVHYETQPLPTPIAWYFMQAPLWFHKASTAFMFVVELGLPLLMFGPRRLKHIAAFGTIMLQVVILLTGNYTFFNLLAISLCLFLLDDALLSRFFSDRPRARRPRNGRPIKPIRANRYVTAALFILIVPISVTQFTGMLGLLTPEPLELAVAKASIFGIVNEYGLFANMTTTRPEISIEGSNDGVEWQPYIFKYKAGPLNRAPRWVAPMQPRVDWQMWFAALENYRENPWLLRFMERLLEGSPPVLELLESNPFAGKPPKFVRAMLYRYHFTNFDERRQTGNWWKRELKGTYFPPISLRAANEEKQPETR